MREDKARPSFSRTMGAPTIFTGRSRSRGQLRDHLQLLVVLFAEHRRIGRALGQELGDHGGDAFEEMRAEGILKADGCRARGTIRVAKPCGYMTSTDGAQTRSTWWRAKAAMSCRKRRG